MGRDSLLKLRAGIANHQKTPAGEVPSGLGCKRPPFDSRADTSREARRGLSSFELVQSADEQTAE